jgi:hypothetical protein
MSGSALAIRIQYTRVDIRPYMKESTVRPQRLCILMVLAAMCIPAFAAGYLWAADPPAAENLTPDRLKPKWEVGQTWTVETKSRPMQAGAPVGKDQFTRPIRWQFVVKSVEPVDDRDCYRVQISNADDAAAEPTTTFWADKETLSLRKIETRHRVQGKWRTMTQNYQFKGNSTPVLGLANAIPVDLPSFSSEKPKGASTYVSKSGTEKTRGSGGLNFATQVDQQLAPADPERVKGLLGEKAKSRGADPSLVEVQLKTPTRRVAQYWEPGSPWPAYSDNGTTVSQLVKER